MIQISAGVDVCGGVCPQLYQPLNIFIALVGVEVWKDEDQVEISKDGDKTLTNFLNYRKVRLIRDHPNDNAQLLT